MNADAKTKRTSVRRALLRWYRASARDLPWRRTRDPYRIWLSEVLLQQTRVEAAIPYYRRFVKAFPNVRQLAASGEERVLKLWEGLGYYSRARNLHRAARRIVNEHGGKLPQTAEALRALPGVGRYTAGAVASIAFGEAVPVVDGNVKRVFARLYGIEASIDEGVTVRRLWDLAEELLSPSAPGDFNQALMELGARVCVPKNPRCTDCPVARQCVARKEGRQAVLPVRRRKKAIPHYEIVAAAIEKRGWYLLGKRPPNGLLGGLWEFPGGKVEPGETHKQALRREVKEEVGIRVRVGELIDKVDHAYSHFRITLHLYRCEPRSAPPQPLFHTQIKWIPRSHLDRYPFPAANRKLLGRL